VSIYKEQHALKTNFNKVHIFCDVDGVINVYPDAPYKLEEGSVAIAFEGEVRVFPLHWRKEVTDFFSDISPSEVEFVWLTTWRSHAPKALDPMWGISSRGFLEWDNKNQDYEQSQKGIALQEWAEQHPKTPFIWIDDVALKSWDSLSFSSREDVLGIMPYGWDGIALSNIEAMKEFIKKNSKGK
jgi:hypothetical protein